MPKVILEFNLPEEKEELELARKGAAANSAIKDFYDQVIRSPLKYGELSKKEAKVLESVRRKFFEIMDDYKIGV